jgi:hypothetical protein
VVLVVLVAVAVASFRAHPTLVRLTRVAAVGATTPRALAAVAAQAS